MVGRTVIRVLVLWLVWAAVWPLAAFTAAQINQTLYHLCYGAGHLVSSCLGFVLVWSLIHDMFRQNTAGQLVGNVLFVWGAAMSGVIAVVLIGPAVGSPWPIIEQRLLFLPGSAFVLQVGILGCLRSLLKEQLIRASSSDEGFLRSILVGLALPAIGYSVATLLSRMAEAFSAHLAPWNHLLGLPASLVWARIAWRSCRRHRSTTAAEPHREAWEAH